RTACVSRLTAHDAGESAFRDGFGLVERLASSNAGNQVLVFLLVRVYFLITESVHQLFVTSTDPIFAIAGSFGAHNSLFHFAFACIHLPTLAEHARAV